MEHAGDISLANQSCDLIGDGSQPYALPTLDNVKSDRFKRIDGATLVKLIDGDFKDTIESFTIVDCRYPYEYHGGHIINSLNIHTELDLVSLFLNDKIIDQRQQEKEETRRQQDSRSSQEHIASTSQIENQPTIQDLEEQDDELMETSQRIGNGSQISTATATSRNSQQLERSARDGIEHYSSCSSGTSTTELDEISSIVVDNEDFLSTMGAGQQTREHRRIIIFHCEFSSERGPRLMRLLREKDRQKNQYPELNHPELYLLEGGYSQFFKHHKEYCVPQSYKPMRCKGHRDEMKIYRRRKTAFPDSRKENRSPNISFDG